MIEIPEYVSEKLKTLSSKFGTSLDQEIAGYTKVFMDPFVQTDPQFTSDVIRHKWASGAYFHRRVGEESKKKMKFFTLKEVLDMPIPPIKDLIEGFIQEGSTVLITGSPGTGKTTLATHIALSVVSKEDCLRMKVPRKMKVLFVDEENGYRRIKQKLNRLAQGMGVTEGDILFSSVQGFKFNPAWMEVLKKKIDEYKPDIIIMDCLIRMMEGNERDEQDISKIHQYLKPIEEETNCCFIILHHLRKTEYGKYGPRTLDDIRGSGDLGGMCDQAFILENALYKCEDDEKIFKVRSIKEKDKRGGRAFLFKVKGKEDEPLHIIFGGYVDDKVDEHVANIKMEILEYIKVNGVGGSYKTSVIVKALREAKVSGNATIRKALQSLVDDEVLDGSKYGEYSLKK